MHRSHPKAAAGSLARRPVPRGIVVTVAAVAALAAGCSAPIKVRRVEPPAPAGFTADVPKRGEDAGALLDAIDGARRRLAAGDATVVPAYNHLVGRLVQVLEKSGADPWSAPLELAGARDRWTLVGRAPKGVDPVADRIIPADTLAFRGKYAEHRFGIEGLGAPVVAVTSFVGLGHEQVREHLPLRNLTAVVRGEGRRQILELVDPYDVEEVTVDGRRFPLAADFEAAVMLGLSTARIDKLGLARLLRPQRFDDTAHLNFLQPYDPDRIPVLFVHGLQSSPATFAPLYFSLLEDPEIRRTYQFWVFSYPSGYPYPYSASLLRRELEEVRREYPDHRDLVVVGHSMGSLISRLMVTDAGEKLWIKAFDRPVAETPLTGPSHDLLVRTLVFNHRDEIDRVVFISGPHRGSTMASNWIGRLGGRLVKLPGFMADVRTAVVSAAAMDGAALTLSKAPNSIDTLSPTNPFVLAINEIPITDEVVYHSIMGDRGKGDSPDSSDGIVPYWSSHLDGAASERIVPSNHQAHQNPEGIDEVRRILRLHAKEHGAR